MRPIFFSPLLHECKKVGDLSCRRRRFGKWIPSLRLRSLRAMPPGLHPFPSLGRGETWIFGRMAGSRSPHPNVLPTFRPSADRSAYIYLSSADFALRSGRPRTTSVSNPAQISRGKVDRLHRTPAGFTTPTLMAADFALARSSDRVGLDPSGRGFAPRFLQTPPRGDALALR
jgi:hypothetical protein